MAYLCPYLTYKMKQRILVFSIFLFALLSIGNKGLGQSIVVVTGSLNLCPGASVTLKADNSLTSPTYQWQSSPDAGTSWNDIPSQTNQNFVTSTAGLFRVLINGTAYGPVTVTSIPNPVASFTFTQNNECSNVASVFTNASTGTGLTFSWNFQDPNSGTNNTSTATNPTHTFIGTNGNGNQSFTVSLTATNSFGCDNTTTRTVTKKQLPDASLADFTSSTPFTNCGSATFSLVVDNISTTKTTNSSYTINWGDGSPNYSNANLPNTGTSHTYTSLGYFNLVLTVTGQNGCVSSKTYSIYNGSNPAVPFTNPGSSVNQCVPFNFSIPSTTNSNPPGTVYTFTKNDNTPIETFQHPPPTSYSHVFTNSSCGATGGITPNTYYVIVRAQNPCGFSDLTIQPITTSKKPIANFSISPDTLACVNTSITFANTSTNGVTVNNSGVCDTRTQSNWIISPATGWATSGSLGDATPTFNPATWGSTNLNVTFTTAGRYSISMIVRNTCGNDTITKTVCIQAPPVPSFTANSTTFCAPQSITINNTSTGLPICGSVSRLWNVTKASSTCSGDSTSDFSYTTSTNSSSLNPVIRFNNQGIYNLSLSLTNKCGTFTSPITAITVKRKPTAIINASNSVCVGQTLSPSVTANSCGGTATYSWSFPNGTPATSNLANPGAITYATAGIFTISLDVTNECGTTTVTKQVVVNETPEVTVPVNKIVCNGFPSGAFNFTSAVPGATFNWTNNTPSIGLSANGTGNIVSFVANNTSASPIIATITVTPSLGTCIGTPKTFTITVNPTPSLPIVTSTVTYCQNAIASALTATPTSGHTLLWYTTATGGVGSATAPTPSTSAATTLTYYVSQVNSTTNCEGNRASINVIINASPVIGSSSSNNTTTCATSTGSIVLGGLLNSTTYGVSYVLNGNTITANLQSNSSGVITINGLASGTYNTVTVTRNNCPSLPVGPFTISDPNPPATPSASANSPLCSGSTLLLTASSLTAGVTYTWSGPNSFSSTLQNPQIPNITTLANGIYSVTSRLNGCTSPAATVNVVVNQTPATPTANSNSPICSGSDLNLTANSTTAGVSYNWTGPNSFISATQNPTITTATAAASGVYNVTASNGTCISQVGTTTVTVRPTPNITSNTKTDPTQCATSTGSITLSGLTTGQQYVVNFVKGGIAQTAQTITAVGGNVVILALSAGTFTNITVTLNGCISNIVAGPIVLSDPTPPATPVASSNSPICSGNTLTLGASSATPGVTFNWSGPVSFNTTGANPTRTNTTTAMSGVYSVSATLNNCTSPTGIVNVTINQTPATPVASSNSPICSGANLNLTSNSSTGGVTYAWTGPNSFNNATQNPTITAATAAATGLYSVTASNGTCTSLAGTTNVTVKPTPTIAGNTKTDPTQCATNTGSITLSGLTAGQQYVVNFVKGGIAQTAQTITAVGGNIVIPALSAGTYTNITVTLDGCISNIVAGPIVLSDPTPPATPVATSNSPICSGNTLTLGATSTTPGVTFNWSGPASFNTTGANPTRPNSTVAMAGTYSVSATLNNCTSPAGTVNVVINQTPATPTVTSNSPICSNENLNLNAATSTAGVMTYAWTGPNSFISTTQNPTINNATTAASGTYNVVATATTGNCASAAGSTTILVKPTPNIASNSKTDPTNCNTATGTITLTGLVAGTYTVNFTKNGTPQNLPSVIVAANGELVIPNLTAGTYANIQVVLNGCNSNLVVGPITLSDPTPPATPVASSNAPICSGNTLTFTATSATAGVTFNWSGPASFSTTGANPTRTNSTVAMSGVYSVTATLNNCTSPAGTVNVVINQTPVTPTVSSNSPICSNATLNLTASTSTAGTITYAWTGPNSFNSAIQNPSITNATTAASGTYSVIATATTGNCASLAGTTNVLVKPTPDITGNTKTDPTACASSTGTITLNGLTTGQSYIVNFVKGGIAQTAQTIQAVNGSVVIPSLSAGTYTNITVTLDGCISNIIAGPITLSDPAPPATPVASSNSPICSGNTLNLTATSATAGVTFNWSGPASFNTTGATPTRPNSTVAMSGVYSVTATLNNCTSPAGSVSVLINQTPAQPTVTTNSPVCTGTTLNLNSSLNPAANVTYAWTGPNGFSSMAKDTTITNVSTAAAGQYSLVVTSVVGTCPSIAGTSTVVVNPTPAIGSTVLKNPINCNTATGSIVLKGLTTGGSYTIRYTNSAGQQTLNNIVAAGDSVKIDNLPSGTYSNIFVILTNCPSNIVGPFTLVDPNPPATPTVTSNTPICSGSTLNLTSSTTTTGAIQYNWTGPNGFTSANQNPSIINAIIAASGTYSVTATLNACVSAAGTVLVRVDSTPVAPTVSSNAPLCFGSNLNLTATTTFPGTLTYAWTGPNGFTSAAQNPTIPNASELASGTYSLNITATAGNCSPAAVTRDVIVRPLLTQAVINGLDTVFVCNFNPPANAIQNISANLNATRSFETGKWTIISQPVGATASFANDASANTTITYNRSGLYQLQWAITNDVNCPSTKDTVFLSIVDQPQIKQDLTATAINVCAGNPVTISVPSNQVVGAIRYWQFKRPYTNASWQDTLVTNPTITFNNVQDTFSVRLVVISTNQLKCSNDTAFKEIKINVAPPSLPGVTTGVDTVCQGANSGTVFLTGNIGSPFWQSSTNGINFTNITPNGAVQNYTYNNLTVTTWFRAAVKSGVCDTVFSNATKITVFPPVTIANAGVDVELCGDSTIQLNGNLPSSIETGVWSFALGSPTATIVSPNAPNTVVRNMIPNTNYRLVWTLSNGICSSTTDQVEIKNYLPLSNTIDTSTITVCNSVVVNITGNPPVGGNIPYLYQWQILQGGNWVNIPGANSISYTFTADTTVKIRRQVTAIPCSNTSLEKTIYVQPPLANNTVSGNLQTCINTSPGVLTGSLPTGADGNYFYQWQILQGTTWTNISGATQKDYTVPVMTVTSQYRRLVTSALCSGNQGIFSTPFEVVVRPDAIANWVITKDTACAPFNINNTIVSPVVLQIQNGSYSWYANNIFYGNNATQNPGYILNNAGDSVTIKMVAVSLYGCKNDSLERKFFTIPPVLTNFTLSDSVGCGPLAVTITNTTPYLGFFNYAWNFGNQQTSNLAQPGTVIYQANPNFTDTTYFVTLTATSECEVVTKTKSVLVKAKPKSIFTPDKTVGCSPLTVNFTNVSKGLGATYIWDFGDGTQQAIATQQGVNHTFVTGVQDTFKVKLISINQCGNDTAIYDIVVAPSTLKLDFAVNGTEKQGCKQHTVRFINASNGVSSFQWNFGDGNTLNTTKNIDTISHTFLQSGTFNVTVFATNGCTDTTAKEVIQVFNPPTANFTAAPLSACIGDTIRFTNQSDTVTSLLWSFRDGYTSSVTNPVHAFATAGVFNVQLKAIRQYNSGLACIDSIIRPITIVSKLPGLYTVTDSISNCVPFTATFTNRSLPSSLTVWYFALGITDTGNIVTRTFTQVGTYTVKMVAKHPTGCTYEAEKNIVVRAPSGTITYDHNYICGNTPVRLEANVQNTDSIRWNFGDGTFLTTASPVIYHTYNQSGFYVPTATLTTNSLSSCSVLVRGLDTIKVDYLKAGFRHSSLLTCGNTRVQFTDTSRRFLPITSWRWSFGDGTFSTQQNPIKNYTASNNWQIQLIVTSASGCSDTITRNIFIKVNTIPSANINAPATACTNRPVSYEAQYVSADTVSIVNWSFTNGVVLTGTPVNNFYLNTGTYTATLIVGTLYGCQDTTTKTITINQSPTITASPDATICKGQSRQLNVAGTNSYSWSPIDGSLSCTTCANPIAKPLTTTQYVVTGTNTFGCTAIDTVVITVAQPIDITVSPNDTICIGQSSQLSVSGATTYTWSPSTTLSNATGQFTVATPILTTRYRVIGFDSYNCFQDTAFVTVAVGQYPTVNLGADRVLATGTPLPLVTTTTNGPITKWTWGPSAATLSCADCPTPIATIKREICYTVEAANLYKCAARDTMCVKVFCENSQVFIPNAFTPDGDGINDVLMVRAQGIRSVKNFRIFNRWGQLVFEKNNFNPNDVSAGWDGRINGKLASPDVYVYMCEVVCENDISYTYKGNVSIVK